MDWMDETSSYMCTGCAIVTVDKLVALGTIEGHGVKYTLNRCYPGNFSL